MLSPIVWLLACAPADRQPVSIPEADLTLPAYAPLPEGADLDARLEVMFAPSDPTVTAEVALIDRVRTARLSDAATYADGENPYRIRYAVYNLRNPVVVERLITAADEGVDVQILVEQDQLDPERDYNWAYPELIARGFEYAEDHRDLDDAGRDTADLVGIAGSGLMHLKTRLYETPDRRVLLTGSMNPGDDACQNDETLHVVNDEAVVAKYAEAYERVLRGEKHVNTWDDGAAINVLFTPETSGDRASGRILDWLADEDEQIVLMMFSLRDLTGPGVSGSLVSILGERVAAGVPVYVITDRKQSDGVDANGVYISSNDSTEDKLRSVGVHVYEVMNTSTPYTAMHHKVAILGRTDVRVITDAANWTKSGTGSASGAASNTESLLFIDSTALDDGRTGRRYLAELLRVLEVYAPQQADAPQYDEVLAEMQAASGWPVEPIRFRGDEVTTAWGERVWARGDLEALGEWGYVGDGVELFTDEATYPTWTAGEIVEIPLGTPLQWKLVAGYSPDAVRWETGLDRTATAAPAALLPGDATTIAGTWRP